MSEPPVADIRVVDAGRGAAWWARGWRFFTAAVGVWFGIMFAYMALSALMSGIPYVGDLGQWLLTPVFMGGLMLGCQALERGERLRFQHLFEGFQGERFVPLVIIGAVNIGLALGIYAVAALGDVGFTKLASRMQAGSDPAVALERALDSISGLGVVAGLLVLVILAVFFMLNWFAPALVALQGRSAWDAMKLSFLACMRNWAAMLVYGAIGAGIMIAGGVALVAVIAAVGASAFVSGSVAAGIGAIIGIVVLLVVVAIAAGLVLGPILFGTTYAAYQDMLVPREDGAQGA